MSRARLLATGHLGAAWGVLTLAAYLLAFVFAASTPTEALPVKIAAVLALLAFSAAMVLLRPLLAHPGGKAACLAAAVVAIATAVVVGFVPIGRSTPHTVVAVLLGLSMIAVGAFATFQEGAGSWRVFAILLMLAGVLKAIVFIGNIVHPFVACAAGTVLFVATRSAANQTA